MERVIKFRAWHSKANNWVMPCDIPKCFVEEENSIVFEAAKNIKLMQYTGLKDKNEKEIYEGDIIKTRNGIGVVIWLSEFDGYDITGWVCGFRNQNIPSEVIGNIYENPELIKK